MFLIDLGVKVVGAERGKGAQSRETTEGKRKRDAHRCTWNTSSFRTRLNAELKHHSIAKSFRRNGRDVVPSVLSMVRRTIPAPQIRDKTSRRLEARSERNQEEMNSKILSFDSVSA